MVNLLLSPERDLRKSHVVKTIYDPACGTGGMLSVAEIVTRYMADREFQGSAFPILAREIFEAVREARATAPAEAAAP